MTLSPLQLRINLSPRSRSDRQIGLRVGFCRILLGGRPRAFRSYSRAVIGAVDRVGPSKCAATRCRAAGCRRNSGPIRRRAFSPYRRTDRARRQATTVSVASILGAPSRLGADTASAAADFLPARQRAAGRTRYLEHRFAVGAISQARHARCRPARRARNRSSTNRRPMQRKGAPRAKSGTLGWNSRTRRISSSGNSLTARHKAAIATSVSVHARVEFRDWPAV
jgi:hypothetical protein